MSYPEAPFLSRTELPLQNMRTIGGRRRDRRAPEGLAAVPVGGGEAWPGFEATHRATSATRPHWCEGRRRDLPRCRWAVAGPGRASRRRAERSSQRGRLAGGPPPTGTHRGRALRRPEHPRRHKQHHHSGGPPPTAQPVPAGNARRSSPSEPCARAGASRPGRSGCGPRCAAPRLRCQ